MRIFLTGGTGFVGSHFINAAHDLGCEIFALKRLKSSSCKIKLLKEPIWIESSFDKIQFEDLNPIDIFVHLAAHSANQPYDTLENCLYNNLTLPLIVFRKAVKAGITKFLVTGSCFEYGLSGLNYDFIPANAQLFPTQTYPASKAAASISFVQFAKENNISLSLLRLFQIYGEGELSSRLYPSLKNAALSNKDFKMTKGEQIRDFLNVSVAAKKLVNEILSLQNQGSNIIKIQNIGSGNPMSVLDFSRSIWSKYESKGSLLPGTIPYRKNEVMKYIPSLEPFIVS